MVCRDWDAGNVIADVLHTGKGIAGNPVVSNGQVDPAADGQQSHAPTGPESGFGSFVIGSAFVTVMAISHTLITRCWVETLIKWITSVQQR
jgi:hypothetical protein